MKTKKAKAKAKPLALINLKVSSKDRKAIEALAKKHAFGNVSAWLRYSGLHFKPKKTDFIR